MPNEFGSGGIETPNRRDSDDGGGDGPWERQAPQELTAAERHKIEEGIVARRRQAEERIGLSPEEVDVVEQRFGGDLPAYAAWRWKQTGSLPAALEALRPEELPQTEQTIARVRERREQIEATRPTREQLRIEELAQHHPEGGCRADDEEGALLARELSARAFELLDQTAKHHRAVRSRAVAVAHVEMDGDTVEHWVAVSSSKDLKPLKKQLSEGETFVPARPQEHAEQALIRAFRERQAASQASKLELVAVGVSKKICGDEKKGEGCRALIHQSMGSLKTHPLEET